jgi:hypothetical protein
MVRFFDTLSDFGRRGKNPFACHIRFDWNVRGKIFPVGGNERERKLRCEWIKLSRHLHAVGGAGFDTKILQICIQVLAKGADSGCVRLLDGIARWQTAIRC